MHNRRRVVCSTLQEFAHGFSLHERVNDKQEQCLPLDQRPECLLVSMAPDCNSVVCQGGGETYHKLAKYSTFFVNFPPNVKFCTAHRSSPMTQITKLMPKQASPGMREGV